MGDGDDDESKRNPPVTDLSDPVGAFRPSPAGELKLQATEVARLDAKIIATRVAIGTTGRPERAAVLSRKLEILKAKREGLKWR